MPKSKDTISFKNQTNNLLKNFKLNFFEKYKIISSTQFKSIKENTTTQDKFNAISELFAQFKDNKNINFSHLKRYNNLFRIAQLDQEKIKLSRYLLSSILSPDIKYQILFENNNFTNTIINLKNLPEIDFSLVMFIDNFSPDQLKIIFNHKIFNNILQLNQQSIELIQQIFFVTHKNSEQDYYTKIPLEQRLEILLHDNFFSLIIPTDSKEKINTISEIIKLINIENLDQLKKFLSNNYIVQAINNSDDLEIKNLKEFINSCTKEDIEFIITNANYNYPIVKLIIELHPILSKESIFEIISLKLFPIHSCINSFKNLDEQKINSFLTFYKSLDPRMQNILAENTNILNKIINLSDNNNLHILQNYLNILNANNFNILTNLSKERIETLLDLLIKLIKNQQLDRINFIIDIFTTIDIKNLGSSLDNSFFQQNITHFPAHLWDSTEVILKNFNPNGKIFMLRQFDLKDFIYSTIQNNHHCGQLLIDFFSKLKFKEHAIYDHARGYGALYEISELIKQTNTKNLHEYFIRFIINIIEDERIPYISIDKKFIGPNKSGIKIFFFDQNLLSQENLIKILDNQASQLEKDLFKQNTQQLIQLKLLYEIVNSLHLQYTIENFEEFKTFIETSKNILVKNMNEYMQEITPLKLINMINNFDFDLIGQIIYINLSNYNNIDNKKLIAYLPLNLQNINNFPEELLIEILQPLQNIIKQENCIDQLIDYVFINSCEEIQSLTPEQKIILSHYFIKIKNSIEELYDNQKPANQQCEIHQAPNQISEKFILVGVQEKQQTNTTILS